MAVKNTLRTTGYVVMECACMQEYCNGGSLRDLLHGRAFVQHGMVSHWSSVMLVMQGIAAGMAYVHSKRICHGDLNPSNVLLKVRIPCGAFQNYPVCSPGRKCSHIAHT
jgi:serine/threonine protein kinase